MDKYGIDFTVESREQVAQRLVNQLWKLVPMREKGEDWEMQLSIVIEEISGLAKVYRDNPQCLTLLSKLEGLTSDVCRDFMIYRRTVFKCIDLCSQVVKNG